MFHSLTAQNGAQPRLVISGLSGGGGKTLLSLGLARTVWRRGLCVKPYKKGPDYIDAAWLSLAAKRAATNLDPFFLDDERLRALFLSTFDAADFAVIEGNRGLYDGRDLEGSCSTARVARVLCAPVVLVLNCAKMTRTAAAIVAGLASFEDLHLGGVVLNRVGSARHTAATRNAIEHYTGIPVLGAIPRLHANPLPERHMGLCSVHDENATGPARQMESEANENETILNKLAALIHDHCDVDALLALGQTAAALPAPTGHCHLSGAPLSPWTEQSASCSSRVKERQPQIGYVQDAALWFYYEENLEALRQAGAHLVRLSLFDEAPWPALDGLYLGGGFPEMLAERISTSPHLETIRRLSESNRPVYAECGGFMLLCRWLHVHGRTFPMADILPADVAFCSKPQGLGYVEASVTADNPFHPKGSSLRGHEFHYSRCVFHANPDTGGSKPAANTLLRLSTGVGMGAGMDEKGCDGLLVRRTFAAYTHLFAPAVPHWAERFVAACRA